MKKLWQLKNLQTNEPLNDPQPLPENWGPIFGLNGFEDKLGDLSWVGMPDKGWFVVGEEEEIEEEVKHPVEIQIEEILRETLEKVAADNTSITKGERADWIEYRRLIKEIPFQAGYPDNIHWPIRPGSN